MIALCHRLPGRLRWYVPNLRHHPGFASRAVAALRGDAGVRAVRVNAAAASLVVQFDPAVVSAARLEARLRELAQDQASKTQPAPLSLERSRLPTASVTPCAPTASPKGAMRPRGWLAMLGLHPKVEPPGEPSLVCRLNLRLMRWLLRTSLRAWWHEQTPAVERTRPDGGPGEPRLGVLWAHQLAQFLLNEPREDDAGGQPLTGRLVVWWRRNAARVSRLTTGPGELLAQRVIAIAPSSFLQFANRNVDKIDNSSPL